MTAIDLVGQRFDRLFVVERGNNSPSGKYRFWYVCDCGTRKLIQYASGWRQIKSCGCYRVEFGRRSGRFQHIG